MLRRRSDTQVVHPSVRGNRERLLIGPHSPQALPLPWSQGMCMGWGRGVCPPSAPTSPPFLGTTKARYKDVSQTIRDVQRHSCL